MKVIKMECPYCGGSLEVHPDQKIVTCTYCGKQILLEDTETKPAPVKKTKKTVKKSIWMKRISIIFVCLLIFFDFVAVLTAIDSERTFASILAVIQIILLAITFVPSMQKKKHALPVLIISSCLLLIPYSIFYTSPKFEKVKDVSWPDNSLSRRIPEPENPKGTIPMSDSRVMYAYLKRVSPSQYSSYVQSCKDKGFTEYAKEDSYGYDAVDQDGYVLSLSYSSYDNEMDIRLEAPKPWKQMEWPVSTFGSLLPDPQSDTGYIQEDSNTYLDCYIKDIDSDQYTQYISSVLKKGFNVNYHRSDEYFTGKDKAGNSVYISLDTGNIMHISLYAPE